MHGDGIKMVITSDRDFPALLDVTRLLSRVGTGPPTGVDRVELAYLNWCLSTEPEIWGVARLASGQVFVDKEGLRKFKDKVLNSVPWGRRDLRSIAGIKTAKPRGRAESDLRRLAVEKGSIPAKIDQNSVYLNIGHSNLKGDLQPLLRQRSIFQAYFVHDVIPLAWPQYQRPGSPEKFRKKLELIADNADLIITNSNDSRNAINQTLNMPKNVVQAHLGVDILNTAEPPQGNPYFVTLGTIEPRKNHALLLDIWEEFQNDLASEEIPDLLVIGRSGWGNDSVLNRISKNKHIKLYENLDDTQVFQLLGGAQALLFPSFAEGFGLPSLEAAALGVPVVCGELTIHRELLGDYPVYAGLTDRYFWKKTITTLTNQRQPALDKEHLDRRPRIPTWDEHFAAVNRAVMDVR